MVARGTEGCVFCLPCRRQWARIDGRYSGREVDRRAYYDLDLWYTDVEGEEPQTHKDSQLSVSFLHRRFFPTLIL